MVDRIMGPYHDPLRKLSTHQSTICGLGSLGPRFPTWMWNDCAVARGEWIRSKLVVSDGAAVLPRISDFDRRGTLRWTDLSQHLHLVSQYHFVIGI